VAGDGVSTTIIPMETAHAMPPDVEKAYVKFLRDHHGEIDAPALAETMWNAGARHMAMAMREASGILPELATIENRIGRIRQMLEELQ